MPDFECFYEWFEIWNGEMLWGCFHYMKLKLVIGFWMSPLRFIGIWVRADLIVEDNVILELKSVERINPAHKKQLLTYLKSSHLKLGYLLNFGEALMKDGALESCAIFFMPDAFPARPLLWLSRRLDTDNRSALNLQVVRVGERFPWLIP
jgi:hypothetical protein